MSSDGSIPDGRVGVVVRVDEDGSHYVNFEGDTDGMPLMAPSLLGAFADAVPLSKCDDGDVLGHFPPDDPDDMVITDVAERQKALSEYTEQAEAD